MFFSEADSSALGRCLAQVSDEKTDIVDLFLEQRRQLEMRSEEPGPGVIERRDGGLAVRLVRQGATYMAARDGFETGALESALREVARVAPVTAYRVPELSSSELEDPDRDGLEQFPGRLRQAVHEQHAAFEFSVRVGQMSRKVQLVGRRLVPEGRIETFFNMNLSTPWGRFGVLSAELDADSVEDLGRKLLSRFRARAAPVTSSFAGPLVLAPAATAVLLHEAVAHTLEIDTLVLSGRPESGLGVELGSNLLDVVDSPDDLPGSLGRTTDDEGVPVIRRWLLRQGKVSQPLADRFHAGRSRHLLPGAARRSSRHLPPVPRSTHLELATGQSSEEELLAGAEGIYFSEITRGRLDPLSGELVVEFPYGRRFRSGQLEDWVGPCRLRAKASSVLGAVEAVGREARFSGAGWCAKGGQRLPVWATSPSLRLAGLEVTP